MRALLADPPVLTPDPADADLFLVPAFGTNMERLLEYYEARPTGSNRGPPTLGSRQSEHIWLLSSLQSLTTRPPPFEGGALLGGVLRRA